MVNYEIKNLIYSDNFGRVSILIDTNIYTEIEVLNEETKELEIQKKLVERKSVNLSQNTELIAILDKMITDNLE
jgi:hypothetical protein